MSKIKVLTELLVNMKESKIKKDNEMATYLLSAMEELKCNKIGYIYFIYRCNQPNIIKVGFTVNLNKRIKCGQTFNDSKLILYKAIQTKHYKQLEKSLHYYLNKFRKEGEWFNINYTMVDNLVDSLVKQYNNMKIVYISGVDEIQYKKLCFAFISEVLSNNFTWYKSGEFINKTLPYESFITFIEDETQIQPKIEQIMDILRGLLFIEENGDTIKLFDIEDIKISYITRFSPSL